MEKEGFAPEIYARWLIEEVKSSPRPFLAYYAPNLVHAPFINIKQGRAGGKWHFAEMVTYLDAVIGGMIKNMPNDTMIMFVADNGTQASLGGGKRTLTDLGCNVPLVVAGPGVISGLDHSLIDLTDFHPSIAEIAGVDAVGGLHGQSFAPQIRGQTGAPRTHVVIYMKIRGQVSAAVRGHRYKLYRDGRFFDLSIDHREENPIPFETIQQHYLDEYKTLLNVFEKTPNLMK